MKIGIFSDPHLGLRRLAGTTSKTQNGLKALLSGVAHSAVDMLQDLKAGQIHCLGDVFDKFSNAEEDISEAAHLIDRCDFVLAGNHDVSNQVDKSGSLKLLAQVNENHAQIICISPDPTKPYFQIFSQNTLYRIEAIPHCISGEVFKETIEKICSESCNSIYRYLYLHCNVGSGFGESMSSHELWLTDELAALLADAYDRVFVGHEHESSYYDVVGEKLEKTVDIDRAKIIVVGNTYPVNFGEIADRYVFTYDPAKNTVERHVHVERSEILKVADVSEVISGSLENVIAPYLRIEGKVLYSEMAKFYSNLHRIYACNPAVLVIGKYYEEEGKGLERIKTTSHKSIEDIVKESAEAEGFSDILKEIENA